MVSVVGGSGVFSGPTGAQYQQAGVEGLSGALAQQRAFAEQQRAQKYKELYDLAKAEADANGVPISTIFGDTAFQETAKAMLGNTMGGFLGLGGQRRLNQFLQGLEATYGGPAGEAFGAQRAAVRGEIVRGEPVVERTMTPGYEQAVAGIMAPPAPPAAVTPPPAPGTQPPASTPAPASTVPPVSSAGHLGERVAVGGGTPTQSARVEAYQMAADQAAAAGQPALPGPKAAAATPGVRQTPLGFQAIGPDGQALKDGKGIPLNYKTQAEAQAASQNAFAPKLVSPTLTPGLAESKPAPEAAGQSAGVGATAPVDPQQLDTATLQNFWTKMYQEGKVTNPMAQVDTMRKLVIDNPGSFQRLMGGSVQGTTPASAAAAAPVGLELPTKLGWSSDDIALFRRFNGRDIEDYQNLSGQERADYQRYVRLNTQLKNEFTKEVRKESTGWRAADPRDKSVSTEKALEWMRASDPNGPIASDPQFSHLAENVHQLGINRVKAEISKLESEGIYTKAMAAKMFQDAQSVDLISKAAYLKERSAAVKSMAETGSKLLEPILSGYTEMLKGAKNDADRKSAEAWFNSQLANNAWFKSNAELFTKEMASVTGNPISVKEVPTDYWRFLFWSGAGESGRVPTVSPFGTGAAPAPDQTAEDVMAQNGW